jgi:hypothetical protein
LSQPPPEPARIRLPLHRRFWFLPILAGAVFVLLSYGGLRSPDTEIVYRVAESLVDHGDWELRGEIEGWPPGFGGAVGRDGRRFSVYGPGQSVFLAPLVPLGRALASLGVWNRVHPPASHFVGRGVERFLQGQPVTDPRPHGERLIVAWADLLLAVALVALFQAILARLLPGAWRGRLFATLLFAFGTYTLSYAGTAFSETLATVLALLGLYLVLGLEPASPPTPRRDAVLLSAGLIMGASVLVHPIMALFGPFVIAWACWVRGRQAGRMAAVSDAARLLLGFGLMLALLGWFNWSRFGDIIQTGRNLSPYNKMAFIPPWRGLYWVNLYHLLLGSGKGLLVVVPAAAWGACCWRFFHRRHPALSAALGAVVIARVLFTASYNEWHGGLCLGPRYLYPVVPFLILPVAFWVEDRLARGSFRPLAATAGLFACVAQQLYFSTGEIFSFYHRLITDHLGRKINVFLNDALYVDWSLTPLYLLLRDRRGPWLLQAVPVDNHVLWLLLAAVALAAMVPVYRWLGPARPSD